MHQKKSQGFSWFSGLIGVVIGAALIVLLFFNLHDIRDWWLLRGYTAPQEVVRLADESGMSAKGRHLFYLNRPKLISNGDFREKCDIGMEKTIVLGCYLGGDRGIYLYDVNEPLLAGVEQTTAAHEMLHAAYDRMPSSEKKRINAALDDYYNNELSNERIKVTLDAYRAHDASEIYNEMHSIFATEIQDLPPELEKHYEKYFSNRRLVVEHAQRYESEFTSRRDRAKELDKQLEELQKLISDKEQIAATRRANLQARSDEMTELAEGGNITAHNQRVASFNAAAYDYNDFIEGIRQDISRYNSIADERNRISLEERNLVHALSGEKLETIQ